MKKDYGMVNREEGPLFGASPPQQRRGRRNDKQKLSKRQVAIGSSVVLLATGAAVCAYAGLSSSPAPVAVEVSNLNADDSMPVSQPIAPISVPFVAPITHDDIPPMIDFDLDLDGKVSVEEYLHHSIRAHDAVLNRVEASDLSETSKDFISDRLRRNYASEAWCVAQLAAKDLDSGAMAMNDFRLFYSIIHEVCDFLDPEIPLEYQPNRMPSTLSPTGTPSTATSTPSTDTTSTPTVPPRNKYPAALVPEGHAIKCDWDEPDVFRFVRGERRWYPDAAIAASWDPYWQIPLVVDCAYLKRGDDMKFNGADPMLPPTKLLPNQLIEGQAIKCEWTDAELFRFTEGVRRWYPDPAVAASWDPLWETFVVADCSVIVRGEDMKMFGYRPPYVPPQNVDPALLIEGQAIKCNTLDSIAYRFTNGQRRWYPTPEIAASWDPVWLSAVYTNCTTLVRGEDMMFNGLPSTAEPLKIPVSALVEGQPIKCEWDDAMVFRFTQGVRRWYPTPEIAASWDPQWSGAMATNCSLVLRGDDMPFNAPPSPTKLPWRMLKGGESIKCEVDDTMIYRYWDEQRRWYPTAEIAESWDPSWTTPVLADCTDLVRGTDMEKNYDQVPTHPPKLDPSNLYDGQPIRCEWDDTFVYRFTNDQRRWYPTVDIAMSWDPFYSLAAVVDCTNLHHGDDMEFKDPSTPAPPAKVPQSKLLEGQSIKCDATDMMVFRYTEGVRRYYPTPAIAQSWDHYWDWYIIADCSTFKRGKDMAKKPTSLWEGQSVQCGDSTDIYRYSNGTLQLYPDPQIAASWDSNFIEAEVVDCSVLDKGPKLPLKLPPPINLAEGQPVKCSPTGSVVYRYTSGLLRLYPTNEIANSWDPAWNMAITVDCTTLAHGDDMPFKKPNIPDQMIVRCEDSADEFPIFLFENGSMHQCPTHEVALSWDAMWMDAVAVNCAAFPRGNDTDVKPIPPAMLNEGQPVRCGPLGSSVFRFANGLIRRYRTPEIATSWGVGTTDIMLTDCSLLRVGDDMGYNQPPMWDGMAVTCAPDGKKIFRFTNRTLRMYPDTIVAESWDSDWRSAVPVFCDGFTQGSPMTFFPPKLREGQSVRCTQMPQFVFRYAGGILRLYEEPKVAASWDPLWESSAVLVDCMNMATGTAMNYNWPLIPDGQALRCNQGSGIFRYSNRTIRLYPTNEIAESWDLNWTSAMPMDCSIFKLGPEMVRKYPLPTGLPEGQAIKCADNQTMVYRLTSGQRRVYSTDAIAASWDPNWKNFVVVDCAMLLIGSPMTENKRLLEGQTVRCKEGSTYFRYTNGTLRLYPDELTAASWDRKYASAELIDCSRVPFGLQMATKPPTWLKEGQAIKCLSNQTYVYRYTCGERRKYRSADIAASWDPNWQQFLTVDCNWLFESQDMPWNSPGGALMEEGLTMKCAGDPASYRYCSGQRRNYWNNRTALSWDRSYLTDFVSVQDCSNLPVGNPMMIKMPLLSENQAVKCDDSPDIYRFTRGQVRRYPSYEVAAMYDANWRFPVKIDCDFLYHGLDMEYPRPDIPEGKAVKCDATQSSVFRFASGELRLYPNDVIATSWDHFWSSNFTTVNCTMFSRGRDMEYKQPAAVDGQAVRCDNGGKVFRYSPPRILRLYPTPEIAASWDPFWEASVLLNCSGFDVSKPMQLHLPPPIGLPDGHSIRCDPNSEQVYRLTGGQLRLYPDSRVALSWDGGWKQSGAYDCSSLQFGDAMAFNQPPLWDGAPVKCDDTQAVYRFMYGYIHLYPNPEIAESWDQHWGSPLPIDCSGFQLGPPMKKKLPSPFLFPIGTPIKCFPEQKEIYRLTNGQYRLYPTDRIAGSWDPEWLVKVVAVDCDQLESGPDMEFNQPPIMDGQAIKCDDGPNIFRYMNGMYHWYPNPPIAASWDPNWASPIFVDCSRMQQGNELGYKLQPPFGLPDGQSVRCGDSPGIYRYTSGQVRLYSMDIIAWSWDQNWMGPIPVDCSTVPRGPDMEFNQPFLAEGRAIRCIGDAGQRVYRYNNGTIRFYRTGEIAASWDRYWYNGLHINCSQLRFGPEMPLRGGNGWTMIDGSLTQLSFDGKQLCGVNSNYDAMCASENIRGEGGTVWNRVGGQFLQVVVYGDVLYGVTVDNMLMVGFSGNANPGWRRIFNGVKHVTTDNKQVCAVVMDDSVVCADEFIRSDLRVRRLSGKFKSVEVVNGRLFAVSVQDGILHSGRSHFKTMWAAQGQTLEHISVDGVRLCGIDKSKNVVCATEQLGSSPIWMSMDATMEHIVHSGGDIFAVDDAGGIFYRPLF